MYSAILAIHNIVRWIVLIVAVIALGRAFLGMLGAREWQPVDKTLGIVFTSSIDVQLLLGLLLYGVLSPLTKAAFSNFGAAMSNSELRFFVIEHAFAMVLAVVFAHIGSAMSKKKDESKTKFRSVAIWFSLALISILVGIPWQRPLLPF